MPTLRRHLPALGVLALGIVISLIASDLARRADETRVRSLLDLRAELHTRAIERRLASEIDQVQSLAHYLSVDNRTAAAQFEAFAALARSEGIICAFESAHAVAHALTLADTHDVILVGLSGRGDKDMEQARRLLDLPE